MIKKVSFTNIAKNFSKKCKEAQAHRRITRKKSPNPRQSLRNSSKKRKNLIWNLSKKSSKGISIKIFHLIRIIYTKFPNRIQEEREARQKRLKGDFSDEAKEKQGKYSELYKPEPTGISQIYRLNRIIMPKIWIF